MSDSVTISISTVAEQLGISRASAYRAAKRGDIPALRIGRRLVIPRAPYEEMLRTGKQPERAGHIIMVPDNGVLLPTGKKILRS